MYELTGHTEPSGDHGPHQDLGWNPSCLGKDGVVRWIRAQLDGWAEELGISTEFTDAVFRHSVPFIFLEMAAERRLDFLPLSERNARILGIDNRDCIEMELFSRSLERWRQAYRVHRELVLETSRSLPGEAMLCKGTALQLIDPTYLRFASDIDVALHDVDAAIEFARMLSKLGYEPGGLLRYHTPGGAPLEFTMKARILDIWARVDISVEYIESYPSDHDSLMGQAIARAVFERSRSVLSDSQCSIPDATDWLILFLIEITSNHGLRLRDVLDLAIHLDRRGRTLDARRFYSSLNELGLQPFWSACLKALGEAGESLAWLGFDGSNRRPQSSWITNSLMPRSRPRVLTGPSLAESKYLYCHLRRHQGRIPAAEAVAKAILRTALKRITGARSHQWLGDAWARRALFPTGVKEMQKAEWSFDDVSSLALGLSGHPGGDESW